METQTTTAAVNTALSENVRRRLLFQKAFAEHVFLFSSSQIQIGTLRTKKAELIQK